MKKAKKLLSFMFMLSLSVVVSTLLFSIVTAQALSKVSVEDGTYIFYSKLDGNRVMDVAGASTASGTNIQLWEYNGCTAQQFEVKKSGDWYTIQSVCSGMALNVQDDSTKSGANVQQYQMNGSNAQKWQFCDAGDGWYYIKSKSGNNMLDVCGADKTKGTNIQVYMSNGNDAQKWRLQRIPSTSVEDGIYMFYSKLDSNRVMDVAGASVTPGTNIQLWEYNGCTAQQFEVKKSGDWYTIKSVCSGLALNVQGGSTKSGTNVQQYHVNDSNAQKWQFCDAGDGWYYVRSKNGYNMLDVCGADRTKGTNIQVYMSNGNDAQKWKLEKVAPISVEDGIYVFNSKLDSNRVMDVAGASLTPGTNIQSWERNGCNAQQFEVKKSGDWYTIKSVCSGLALDVQGGSTESGANVQQYNVNGSDAQKWQFYDAGDGWYYVRSKSGNNIDICGANKAKGTNIQVYMLNGNDAQKWKLEKVSKTLPTDIYLKQQKGTTTCTLVSAAMMLRARKYLSGESYSDITESSIKKTAWDGGLKSSWSYSGITVTNKAVSGISASALKSLLEQHPEGIVLYCGHYPHAVFLTDYNDDTFYCADPDGKHSKKRIELSTSLLGNKYGGQANILKQVTKYWYVSEY